MGTYLLWEADILPQNGMFDVSRDLFKFWEISDNILLTVQNRDIVAMRH